MVGQVSPRKAARGAGRIASLDPDGIPPAERRERHDSSIEPDVADLRDAADSLATRLAANHDGVDPRPMKLLQLVEPLECSLLELGSGPDNVEVSAGARVEG